LRPQGISNASLQNEQHSRFAEVDPAFRHDVLRGSVADRGRDRLGAADRIDRIKETSILLPAYDDADGLTAAFMENR